MDQTAVWKAVLGELEIVTSKTHFQTCLRFAKLGSLTASEAVVLVPNVFILEWIEKRYRATFLTTIQKHMPQLQIIRFEVDQAKPAEVVFDLPPETDRPAPTVRLSEEAAVSPGAATIVRHQVFTNFVEGNNNRLAFSVASAVAKTPGTLYNPLFIYGGVGLGKTHLMHAIANHVFEHNALKRVLYVSCETFTNDYIAAIAAKKTNKFKQTYRSVDLLLVDDIQFLANKEGSQEEFFNTFNTLHQLNRQIVIAADRPPKAILGLEERLSSRFGGGMVVDIQPPNLETRFAILQSKCQEKGVSLPSDVLEYIATQVQRNIRELEGALNRALGYCQMADLPMSVESARAALSGLVMPSQPRSYSVDAVITLVSDHFGLPLADLIGQKRTQSRVYPRHVAMYILREVVGLSFPDIGRELGGKDHTTVMHGYNKISQAVATNPQIMNDVARLKERVINLN